MVAPSAAADPAVAAATANSEPGAAPLVWTACSGASGARDDQCSSLVVPLNYSDPGGRTITLALARIPASSGHPIGSILLNPGGPGVSGVDSLDYLASLFPKEITDRFNMVAWDPRGTARSAPVECLNGKSMDSFIHLDPAPTTTAGFDALIAGDKAYDQACERHSGWELPYVGTDNTARDMDRIREGLGESKLTYFGFSYGTFLGLTYAKMFPTHIRAMVIDGVVDPSMSALAENEAQSVGFEQDLTAFLADCQRTRTCAWKPADHDRQTAFFDLMARISAHPLPVPRSKRTVGPSEALYGITEALYDPVDWGDLAQALENAEQGDGSVLLELSDSYLDRGANGIYDNSFAALSAISCVDDGWNTSLGALRALAPQAARLAPYYGVADLYSAIGCLEWPVKSKSGPETITAPKAPPILVIGSTGDPATPYQESVDVAKTLVHGVLITRVGEGHTGYRSSSCVRSLVDSYLLRLTVPPSGVRCQSN
jgi:pimeloyl-ACP methyl ester carboxylesterase